MSDKAPIINSVFHLTDFSEISARAFDHALAIARLRQAKLTILHVANKNLTRKEWEQFPAVRKTLTQWGLLEEDASRQAVKEKLGIEIKKVDLLFNDVKKAVLEYLKVSPSDLLVLGTEGRKGLMQWIHPSLAEMLARKTKTKTLFISHDAKPFITHETGESQLQKILVPIAATPDPTAVVEYATRTARTLGVDSPVEIILLHVGKKEKMPKVDRASDPLIRWKDVHRKGAVAQEIVQVASNKKVDLIMMATQGHDSIADFFKGNVTEQVLRNAPCAVAAIPAE